MAMAVERVVVKVGMEVSIQGWMVHTRSIRLHPSGPSRREARLPPRRRKDVEKGYQNQDLVQDHHGLSLHLRNGDRHQGCHPERNRTLNTTRIP